MINKTYLYYICVIITFTFISYSLNTAFVLTKYLDVIKIFANIIINCLVLISVAIILAHNHSEQKLLYQLRVLVTLIWLFALITLLAWYVDTGGQVGRYNYIPPLTQSQGLSILVLVIGSMTGLNLILFSNRSSYFLIFQVACIIGAQCTILVREVWAIFLIVSTVMILEKAASRVYIRLLLAFFMMPIVIYIGFMIMKNFNIDDISFSGESIIVRLQMLKIAWNLFLDNYMYGVGYGLLPLYLDLQVNFINSGGHEKVNSPHNGLILILAEYGFLMSIIIFFTQHRLIKKLRNGYRNRLKLKAAHRMIAVFVLFFTLIFLEQIVSNSLFLPPPAERNVFRLTLILLSLYTVLIRVQPKDEII